MAGLDRRTLIQSAAAMLFALPAQAKPCPVRHVLFICPLGVVQSAIAREELRRAAKARGLPVIVQSRGVEPPKNPENDMSPALAANLRDDGINTVADPLRKMTREDVSKADITIAFNEAAQAPGLEGARQWKSPSWNNKYDEVKAALSVNIQALMQELAAQNC